MNLSLRKRVTFSFILANIVVLALCFIVFHFLSSLNREIESISLRSNRVSILTDEIRISAVSILKNQRRLLTQPARRPELVEKIMNLCEGFTSQLHTLDSLYSDAEVKKVITQMLSYVDSLKLILSKATIYDRDNAGLESISDLSDKILDSFSEFQDIQYFQTEERYQKVKKIITETKKNMMIVLIIGFLATIILGLIMPGKIALPFKKIKDAIRELQECNFDVSIFYNQSDEIGEIAREMNKMIHSFKVFEELRQNRISVENRKFDALANMVRKPVLIANAEGKLIYMNNTLYSLLQVQSEDVIGKTMTDTVVPPSIIESFELAIKRRSKIENTEITITARKVESEDVEALSAQAIKDAQTALSQGELDDLDAESEEEQQDEAEEVLFSGYANVIPIRGKESSLDYYLMVLSQEVFA